MNTILILDKDAKTELSEDFKERILKILKEKAHRVEVVELERNEVMPCLGCLLCLTKHVGICVTRDRIAEVRNNVNRYERKVHSLTLPVSTEAKWMSYIPALINR